MNITIEQELNFPDADFLASVLSVAQVEYHLPFVNATDHLSSTSTTMSFCRVFMALHCSDAMMQRTSGGCCGLQGSGSSDFMDALTVAVDKLHRAVNDRPDLGKANVTKRVVLVSNFLDAAKEDPDDQFGSVLVERMQDKNIRMEVQQLCSMYTALCTCDCDLHSPIASRHQLHQHNVLRSTPCCTTTCIVMVFPEPAHRAKAKHAQKCNVACFGCGCQVGSREKVQQLLCQVTADATATDMLSCILSPLQLAAATLASSMCVPHSAFFLQQSVLTMQVETYVLAAAWNPDTLPPRSSSPSYQSGLPD